MYKTFKLLLSLLLVINITNAQENDYSDLFEDLNNEIPIDPKVRKGKLENGINYYVKQNDKPEDRLVLRLVVNAGKLLENEDQYGLAHFVEHMCFNGTKNFEKNDIVDYLQSIGVKFGADLNAYTSFDETVYFLPIPTDEDEIINQGFQIMEDWAHQVTFSPEEIEKERGVILEEFRVRNDANRRMANEYLPVLLNNEAYEDILNTQKAIDHIKNFEHESLISYYEEWYRPELMAVIAVGDLEPDLMEKKIKTYFGDIQSAENPQKRKEFQLPDHQETYVKIASDDEASNASVQVYFKDEVKDFKTLKDYKRSVLNSLYTGMLNMRLQELTQKPQPPFIIANVNYGSVGNRNKNAFSASARVSEDGIERGLEAVLKEVFRVKRHGFTSGELERYKKNLLKSYEKAYNERDKTESEKYVNEFQRNYLTDEPIPGIEFEYEFVNHIIDDISLEEVNALSKDFIKDYNRVIIATVPEQVGDTLPTEDDLLAILNKTEKEVTEAYKDELSDAILLDEIPEPGKIVDSSYNDSTGVTTLALSNGVNVTLKPTDFKNDEIKFSAFSTGGASIYPVEDHFSASFAGSIVNGCGFGDFSPTDLRKLLSGKNVSVSPYISTLEEGMNGSTTPKDLETMFQLVYLAFTSPNQNNDLFDAYLSRLKAYFKNAMEQPMNYFYDKRVEFMSQGHPRSGGIPTQEELESIDFNRTFEIYRDRFADASDFNFIFVGNFNVEKIKPLIEKYIGGLPAINREEQWKDLGIRPPEGVKQKEVYKGKNPKSLVHVYFHDKYDFDRRTNYYIRSVAEALEIKLLEILREDQSGVYSTGVFSQTSKNPYENYNLIVAFPCAPENVKSLRESAFKEIRKIQENGVTEEDLVKVKETQRRDMEERLEKNDFWKSIIKNNIKYGWGIEEVLNYEDRIDQLKAKQLQEVAKKYFNFDSRATVVLYPEKESESTQP